MKKKRKRFLKLKFNFFVGVLCLGTVMLAYGFDRIHADGIQITENSLVKNTEKIDYTKKVQINKVKTATTESSIHYDKGAVTDTDKENLIPIYASADENSKVLEEVFTGEWAEYFGKEKGFVQIETNKGTHGYVSTEQCKVTDVVDKKKPTSLKNAVIVLDPGHGGADVGAESTNKEYLEKKLTLATAKAVKQKLEAAGATVYLTRAKDTYVSLSDRTDLAVKNTADVFISLHYDSFETSNTMSGYTTYYYYKDEENLANAINQGLSEKIATLKNVGVRTDNFQVTRDNPYPAVLLELGYINSYSDLMVITQDDYYDTVADGIVKGLNSYFGS